MNKSNSVCVIIPAAGLGTRADYAKQFYPISGRPLLCYTIDHFHKHHFVDCIIVATSKDYLDFLTQICNEAAYNKCRTIEGGETRHRSIFNCILAAEKFCPNIEIIIIHDAVRPFLSEEQITNIIYLADSFGACGFMRPLVSTVVSKLEQNPSNGYRAEDNCINSVVENHHEAQANNSNVSLRSRLIASEELLTTSKKCKVYDMDMALDRSLYFNSETPQAFKFHIIKNAYQSCSEFDLDNGTECLMLVKKYTNTIVKLIEGSNLLWKVTYPNDLILADLLIRERLILESIYILNKFEKLDYNCSKTLSYFKQHKKISAVLLKELFITSSLNQSTTLIIFFEDFLSNNSLLSTSLNVDVIITNFLEVLNSYILIEEKILKRLLNEIINSNEEYITNELNLKDFRFKDLYLLIIYNQSSSNLNLDILSRAFKQISLIFIKYGISLSMLRLTGNLDNSFELMETLVFSKRSIFNAQIFHI